MKARGPLCKVLAVLKTTQYLLGVMSLSATTQGFLKEVESSTGFKVLVEEQGSGLQVPLLAGGCHFTGWFTIRAQGAWPII